jgi:hypothetical protein
MKIRRITKALRRHSVPALVAEAGWRGIRSLRARALQVDQHAICPVRFAPIGYHDLESFGSREAILAYADAILRGEYPLLGYGSPHLGASPDWQLDWVSGKRWLLDESRTLPIVRHDGSDVKAPWELSRLQWSPVVAKAWVLTRETKYRAVLRSSLTGWIDNNPVGRGVNWTVAMEAGLRAVSLCLTMDLLWPFHEEEKLWLDQLTASLWQHLRFIEANSEFSFLIRSNHYLSNIVGLTTLTAFLQGPGMRRRFEKYAAAVQEEILSQTYPDGGDREASTGYHVLVAQMFLHSRRVQRLRGAPLAPDFESRLRSMFAWMAVLADQNGQLPHIGDCDNGRIELLCEDLAQAGLPASKRSSLRIASLHRGAADLIQQPFPDETPVNILRDSGIGVVRTHDASVILCAMPNGLNGKGSHTHCDKLSIVFRLGAVEVFSDSGSRGYTRSAVERNADRSTAAHNTLTVDNAEQNILSGDPHSLFQCGNQAAVSTIASSGNRMTASHRGYERLGVLHQRTVELGYTSLCVLDEVKGAGEHALELRYFLGPEWRISAEIIDGPMIQCVIIGPRQLTFACEAPNKLALTVLPATVSREYGESLPASCISVKTTAHLPCLLRTSVIWN